MTDSVEDRQFVFTFPLRLFTFHSFFRSILALLILIAIAVPATAEKKVVYVVVALCDNQHQGIVPVPAALGRGDQPETNLYWGARYGLRSVLDRSRDWEHLGAGAAPAAEPVLQRRVYRSKTDPEVFLIADAFRGKSIGAAVKAFLRAAGGHPFPWPVCLDGRKISRPDLAIYVGHNGLMDFDPPMVARAPGQPATAAMVLACKSRQYFAGILGGLGARPLLLTTGFMAPEAYVVEAALAGWIAGEKGDQIRRRAAAAYHRYQKCGLRAALRLFVTGTP